MGSKPPATVGERIPKDGRHNLGAAARLSTRVFSPEQGGAGGPVQSSPKLVEHIGSDQPDRQNSYPHASLKLQWRRPPCARKSSCLRARLPSWQDVAAKRPALSLLHADPLSSPPLSRPTFSPVKQNGSSCISRIIPMCRKFCPSIQTTFDGSPPV